MKKREKILLGIAGLVVLAGMVLAQEVKDIVLPDQIPGLIDWALVNKVFDVTKYALGIQAVVQLIKVGVVAFGSKLSAKFTPALVALTGTLVLVEQVTADKTINGSDWSSLIVSVLATVLAFFSFKVVWSANAKVNQ